MASKATRCDLHFRRWHHSKRRKRLLRAFYPGRVKMDRRLAPRKRSVRADVPADRVA